jgi:imidazoleglycerol-phosphate dehydratase
MTQSQRQSEVRRATRETDIVVRLGLDGAGTATAATGLPFFDHMLQALARHGYLDLEVRAKGDLEVDAHHTLEDVGLVLGQALREALGDKAGIRRFGTAYVPMDEALARVVIDLSGRPFLAYRVRQTAAAVGGFDARLLREFFQAFVNAGGFALHVDLITGEEMHHISEAVFKACGRALGDAVALDPRCRGVPSTKGSLTR